MALSQIKQFEGKLERENLFDEANPALRSKLEWILDCFHQEIKQSILNRYQIALVIREIYDDVEDNKGRRYGANAVKVIRRYFDWDPGVIYQALRVADAYTSEEITEITQVILVDNSPITYSHVVCLAAEADRAKRMKLLREAIKYGWSSKRLAREIDDASTGKQPRIADRRGRPLAVPQDFDSVLDQQGSFAQDFLNRNTHVWTDPQKSLSARASELDPLDVTPERVERLKQHAMQLRLVADRAAERADEAKQLHSQLAQMLQEQNARGTPIVLTPQTQEYRTEPYQSPIDLLSVQELVELEASSINHTTTPNVEVEA